MEDKQEKSYQEIRKDLIQKYKTEIVPKLSEWEKKRQKLTKPFKNFKKILKIFGIFILIGYLGIPAIIFTMLILCTTVPQLSGINIFNIGHILFLITGIITVVPIVILFFYLAISAIRWSYATNSDLQQKIKAYVMPLVCNCFPNLKWIPDRNHLIDAELYKLSKVIRPFDYIKYDDCFIGSHKGINFVIEEIDARKQSKDKSYSVFRGVMIRFNGFNKKIKGQTVIYPSWFPVPEKLHKTKLEDIIFEKKYDVFTDDDIEARYLITPTFMERLNNIKSIFQAHYVYVSFYKDMFFIGLDCLENLFDYGQILNSFEDPKPFIKMSEEIISILKLIDHFKLNQNIGM